MPVFSGSCVVGYHYPCLDGLYAALIAKRKLQSDGCAVRFIPLSTNCPPRVESLSLRRTETVFLLDFASPRSFVEDVAAACGRLIVIDHHVTAWEALRGAALPANVEFHFDVERCAATMALEYFAPVALPQRVLNALRYVEDSDLWRMALPQTAAFRAGMSALNLKMNARRNPTGLDALLDLNLESVLDNGRRIHAQQSTEVEAAVPLAFPVFLGGRGSNWGQCLAVEGVQYGRLRSAIGNRLAEMSLAAGMRGIGVVAYQDPHLRIATQIKLSFRSVPSEDTTPISVSLGGGGHKCASSCTIEHDTFRQWRA